MMKAEGYSQLRWKANRYTELLREIRESYQAEVDALEKKKGFFDGMFGFGSSVRNDACNDRFDTKVNEILQQTLTDGATAEEIGDTVCWVLDQVLPQQGMEGIAINLMAIQRHCIPLVNALTAEKAGEISRWYEKNWKRTQRLPVQNELLKALKARAGK